jgi:hypothetical protein
MKFVSRSLLPEGTWPNRPPSDMAQAPLGKRDLPGGTYCACRGGAFVLASAAVCALLPLYDLALGALLG